MPKKHENHICILLQLKVDGWRTVVIARLVSLCTCDLFLFHFSHLYDEIARLLQK